MRANHASKALGPARRAVGGGARRAGGRWLPRPRAVAAGGALLAQLWGLGAPGAYAATTDPLPGPVSRTVGRALGDGQNADGQNADGRATGAQAAPGQATDGESAGRTAGTGRGAGDSPAPGPAAHEGQPRHSPGQASSPGLLGRLADATGAVPVPTPVPGLDAATAPVGSALQDRIRAGDLPLPGQRASVPDAFAIASGLLGTAPAQDRTTSPRASRTTDSDSAEASATADRSGTATARPVPPTAGQHGPAAPPPAPEDTGLRVRSAGQPGPGDAEGTRATAPGRAAPHEDLALTGALAAPAGHGLAGTGTAVLAPIAAGLLLTGAAMCKHRGLPRGH
ncbi:hypothetical protein [Kitasatospora sp. NPDC050467]|uniref:hypothetical protein n=1 Tax=unclassified Kitasatospora TaxID=2633591 RepID=UPI0032499F74